MKAIKNSRGIDFRGVNKDVAEAAKAAQAAGAVVERTRKNHLKVSFPGIAPVYGGTSPCTIGVRHFRRDVERATQRFAESRTA